MSRNQVSGIPNKAKRLMATAGGLMIFLAPFALVMVRGAGGGPLQDDSDITVKGGSVELAFDSNVFSGSNGNYSSPNKVIKSVTYLQGGTTKTCSGSGNVQVKATHAGGPKNITVQPAGSSVQIQFDEGIYAHTPAGKYYNRAATMIGLTYGSTTCFNGKVDLLTIKVGR
ncbi:MAG TPA: hypothetical protein VGP94_12030 [Tepidisphaeraceae bacterium]|nr:hypothetical protein [Tepidisphaeraceae bacterium]